MDIKTIDIQSREFPDSLRNIPNPPTKLYYAGNIGLLASAGIAIVGTRRCSPYGRWVSYELGRKLAECGCTVISGMAEGIDTQAHLGCLDRGGNTIAVLGTGVNICFPKSNYKLYERILKDGLLISEIEPDEKAAPWTFPARNRIISGLSRGVVVVEGAIKSGSMITANHALDQGREVFAVPGNINQPNSIGTNMLIRDGATPILGIEEAPKLLGIEDKTGKWSNYTFSRSEKLIIGCMEVFSGISAEEVAFRCDMAIGEVMGLLSALELKNVIYDDGNSYYLT